MSECETVRGLRVELEEARARNEAAKKDLEEILEDRIEAIGGRGIALSKLATFEVVLGNVRSELERITKERDALREEIARRDADKTGKDSVSILDWNNLVSDFNALKLSISSRLDGPTGVEKRIVEVEASIERRLDNIFAATNGYGTRLAKLEARVSKKRVKK